MADILHAIGGALLLCIPVSMVLALGHTRKHHPGDVEMFPLIWFLAYIYSLLLAAVGFAGVVGVAMLTGAFR